MKASLFITCFNDTLFADTGQATVALLERLGVDVDFRTSSPAAARMRINSGYADHAVPLVKRFASVFGDSECGGRAVGVLRRHGPRLLRRQSPSAPATKRGARTRF